MNILFDIGATKTRIARQIDSQSFETPIVFLTPPHYAEGSEMIATSILALARGETIDAVSGCIAGKWDNESGTIVESGNIDDWNHKPIRSFLEQKFQTQVYVDNDAALAGLGEAVFGAGKGFDNLLYITVSTGVGGAYISHGNIDTRIEPRKEIVGEHGESLGRLISGKGVEEMMGMKPKDITDSKFWTERAYLLAKGLQKILTSRTVDVVVLGGSMISEVGISPDETEVFLKELAPQTPSVVKSKLGDFGGLYGGLATILQSHL